MRFLSALNSPWSPCAGRGAVFTADGRNELEDEDDRRHQTRAGQEEDVDRQPGDDQPVADLGDDPGRPDQCEVTTAQDGQHD